MSKSQQLKSILDRAKGKEKEYDWLGAAKLYAQAVGAVGKKDLLRKGEIQERIGYCFHRAAFQAETQEEFRRRMELSVKAYGEAAKPYERLEDSRTRARLDLCRARAADSRSWLAADPTDRTALLDECRTLGKDAAQAYEEIGDQVGYANACNELLTCLQIRSRLAQDAQELKNIVEEALAYGEQAIHVLAATGDEHALTRAYYQLSWGYYEASDVVYESIEKQKNLRQQALSYAEKAVEVSKRTMDKYLIGMSNLRLDMARWALAVGADSSLKQLEKTLELATMTRDALLIAFVRERQAGRRHLNVETVEDPEKRKEEYNKIIQAAEEAIARLELLSYPYIWAYYHHPSSYVKWATNETDLEKKRGLLKKAAGIAGTYVPRAQRSGSPLAVVVTLHILSVALEKLAAIETKPGEKRRLLVQAAEYREAAICTHDRVYPFDYWDRGMVRVRSAGIKVELAKMETNSQKKKDLLIAAKMIMEESMRLIKESLKGLQRSPAAVYSNVGAVLSWFCGVLNQLYLLTGEKSYLERALKICEEAIETWETAGLQSRLAEAHWQMAKFYDQLGAHRKAAKAFAVASKGYTQVAGKLPQLKTFYSDHRVYMQAWSEIENARHAHAEKEHSQAKDHYRKAAALHKKTERWRYLSPNYAALALVEEAEDLSRREQAEEAKDLFEQAARRFVEAKESIEAKLETIEIHDEKEVVTQLAKALEIRRAYCLGRTVLEEAKILDRL